MAKKLLPYIEENNEIYQVYDIEAHNAINNINTTINETVNESNKEINKILKYDSFNTINYGYGTEIQEKPADPIVTNSSTMLGYKRDGMFITLNGRHNVISDGQQTIKVKLNGSVTTTFSNSTIDEWTANSLQLKPNTQYKASLYDLSGVEDFENFNILFYKAGNHTSLGTKTSFNNKIEKIFTTDVDDTITYNLVLLIPYHETHVFINNSFYITLEEYPNPVDTTLTQSNIAADAATVGAKLAALETRIAALENAI